MAKKTKYICISEGCDFSGNKFWGKCPECNKYGTIEEITEDNLKTNTKGEIVEDNIQVTKIKKIKEIDNKIYKRLKTGFKSLDILFGTKESSGIAENSINLIAGEPGVGKSTLLIEIIDFISNSGLKSAYITGEENEEQIKNRYDRIELTSDFAIDVETNTLKIIKKYKDYDFLIIDSIQTLFVEGYGTRGQSKQMRECAHLLTQFAKKNKKTIFLVGQLNKNDEISGPRALEHIIDGVFYLENFDEHLKYKRLIPFKNRFGNVNDMGILEMNDKGTMVEVENTSLLFIDKKERTIGSALSLIFEKKKAIFIEIESLLIENKNQDKVFIQSTGVNQKTLIKVLAILQKHCKMFLYDKNIFINIVGGIKTDFPGIELAIAASIISSYENKILDGVFIGEISFNGNIRKVQYEENLIKEIKKVGFNKIIYSKELLNIKDLI